MSAYPLMLDGTSLEALVVGGGAVAARKVGALLDAGATVRVVAPDVSRELRELQSPDVRLTIAERSYTSEDIATAMLVIAATGDRAVNARVARDARARHRLVNVADAPNEGNCVTAAVHRAGDLVVAVTAGGVPSAAARVRDLVADRVDGRYGGAIAELGELRSRLLAVGNREQWRRASEELVGESFCAWVEDGTFVARVRAWR
ncbi:MAG TPA: bifunctional precorrin-2 dehydrogenase/sirohydrochlorin ferrochelatase [Gemmatimonadaceae bacterium]|nr:bifunctional precorrin-2 dehydrogenase/sirohydrochlorin ferrochelatase [Gemmatimonadaceae bacterium]